MERREEMVISRIILGKCSENRERKLTSHKRKRCCRRDVSQCVLLRIRYNEESYQKKAAMHA